MALKVKGLKELADEIGEPGEWAAKLNELASWTGSAWIDGGYSEGDLRGDLYKFLCDLLGYLSCGEEAARSIQALSAIEQEQEPVAWGWADATGIRSTTLDKSQAAIWAGPNNTVVPLYLSPSVCEGKVTEEMVERAAMAIVREEQTNRSAFPDRRDIARAALTAALSQDKTK